MDKEEDDKETLHFETDLVSYGRQSLAVSPLQTGPRLLSALRAPGGSRPSFIFEPKVMDVGSVALIRWYLHQRLSDEFISSSYLVLPRLTSSYLVLPLITSSHHFEALRKLKRTLQQARGSIFWLREDMWGPWAWTDEHLMLQSQFGWLVHAF